MTALQWQSRRIYGLFKKKLAYWTSAEGKLLLKSTKTKDKTTSNGDGESTGGRIATGIRGVELYRGGADSQRGASYCIGNRRNGQHGVISGIGRLPGYVGSRHAGIGTSCETIRARYDRILVV